MEGIMDKNYAITLDVEGEPLRLALAWAHAAHVPAGAFWPAAFGAVAARTPIPQGGDAIEWLRSIGHETDRLVDELVTMEIQAGWAPVPGPRFPAWQETTDGRIELEWDTSVSLVLGPAEDPGHLRLTLWGEHEERLALAREALARPDRDRAIDAWEAIASLRR